MQKGELPLPPLLLPGCAEVIACGCTIEHYSIVLCTDCNTHINTELDLEEILTVNYTPLKLWNSR